MPCGNNAACFVAPAHIRANVVGFSIVDQFDRFFKGGKVIAEVILEAGSVQMLGAVTSSAEMIVVFDDTGRPGLSEPGSLPLAGLSDVHNQLARHEYGICRDCPDPQLRTIQDDCCWHSGFRLGRCGNAATRVLGKSTCGK